MHNLYYQDQNCSLTLTQGIEEYRNYLISIGRKVMEDEEGSSLITDHDATHVIFGLDTSLEQESLYLIEKILAYGLKTRKLQQ